ncbi:MAG: DUF294 nucleotidyltransferase-like domain-containing protein [Bacteroidota bacterium]
MNIWDKVPKDILKQCSKLTEARIFSSEVIRTIKEQLLPIIKNHKSFALVFAGSLGRAEALRTSDVDSFFLFGQNIGTKQKIFAHNIIKKLDNIVSQSSIGLRLASKGAFSCASTMKQLISNIGGNEDTNETLTRRMVTFTESDGISSGYFFDSIKGEIIRAYLNDLAPERDRLPIFLINDLIRYYRTICIDYEYKKNKIRKPWAIRLAKLRHSRKLLYFSSLLPLFESIRVSSKNRIEWIERQFLNYTPMERMIILINKYGQRKHWDILLHYEMFLRYLSSEEKKKKLNKLTFANRDNCNEYIFLRDNARDFRSILLDFAQSVPYWKENIRNYVIN